MKLQVKKGHEDSGRSRREKCERGSVKCEKCGGSINGDGYFSPKCLCHDFEVMEGNDYADDPDDK